MADLEGLTLDRYELLRPVGRGGMADVYLAYDPHFEREVAVKVFKREDEEMLRRFVREAQLMASLHNAHLIPVYDSGSSRLNGGNVYYIVMPYMEGGTLRSRIRRSPLSLNVACRYLREIADALDYIHQQGIVHRDIKSSNMLLDADGRCYLADFGIARASEQSTQLTTTGSVLGTVDYLAPELFESNCTADRYSDYYSLGVLLYEMVTGRLPFMAENQIAVIAMHVNRLPPSPHTFVPDLPPAVERVMLRALEKRPEMRYGSATELAEAFCMAVTLRQPEVAPVAYPAQTRQVAVGVAAQAQPRPSTRPLPASTGRYPDYTAPPPNYYPAQPSVYPHQPTGKSASRSSAQARIVTVLALLALLAVIGPIVYVLALGKPLTTLQPTPVATTPGVATTALANSPAATQQAKDAAATVTARSTATAQAISASATQQAQNGTATAIAGATATVQAQASATAGVVQTAIATNPAYTDPLNNQDDTNTQAASWDQNDNCSFQSDGYHVHTDLLALHGCREAADQFQNFAAQVDVLLKKGASGGLFFRLKTNALGAYKGYLFEINANGQYRISQSNNFSSNSVTILRDWTDTPALKAGAKNTLQVIARDTTLLLYINGVFMGPPIQDSTFTAGGIAFLATSTKGERANVVYSNLRISAAGK